MHTQNTSCDVFKKRLGVPTLSNREANLIAAVTRLSSRLEGQWEVVSTPPWDVLLLDIEDEWIPLYDHRKAITVYIGTEYDLKNSPETRMLTRPIQADDFIELLLSIWSDFFKNKEIFEYEKWRYQLKRWPAMTIIKQNPHYLKLASILSRNSQDLSSLLTLSGIDKMECLHFIDLLRNNDLVILSNSNIPTSDQHDHDKTTNEPDHVRKEKHSVLQLIRQRLGLLFR